MGGGDNWVLYVLVISDKHLINIELHIVSDYNTQLSRINIDNLHQLDS